MRSRALREVVPANSLTSFDARVNCNDFNALPDELCLRIFSNFHPVQNNLPRLACVCQRWKHLLRSSATVWRTLLIDPTNYNVNDFQVLTNVLHTYGHHIQKLIWKDNTSVYEFVFGLIPKLKNLKQLRLPILWTDSVVQSLAPLSSLEDIQVNGGYALTDQQLEFIAHFFPQLKSVSLNACWGITSNGIKIFMKKLKNLENIKLKINSCLRLNDTRSEIAMAEGAKIVKSISEGAASSSLVSVLCLHFVPIELDELWTVVNNLQSLRKLSVSNCEHLHGIRLLSPSLQKLYLYNLWSVLFISVSAPNLRHMTIDHGMESMEHLEVYASKLRRIRVDGSDVLRTINIKSQRLYVFEIYNCEMLDTRSLVATLQNNPSVFCLKLGKLSQEHLFLNENNCPNVTELSLLDGFQCHTLHVRSPSLRLLQTETESDLPELCYVYIIANHLCKVNLTSVPGLRGLTIQCVSVDQVEVNLCSDNQICLESCVIHAIVAIGFLRIFDCKVHMLVVSTPIARTVVLYRCNVSDYALKMALECCPNIAHLNLEKCQSIKNLQIQNEPLQYLNIFGCGNVQHIHLKCPQLVALNLGQCKLNVKLFLMGEEREFDDCDTLEIIRPVDITRWTHDFPPQPYICNM